MFPPYEHEEWTEFSKNLPKNGMIVDGLCFRLLKWELGIEEKDGSYWLTPTVVNVDNRSEEGIKKKREKRLKTGRTTTPAGSLAEQVKYGHPIKSIWPTPQAWDAKSKKQRQRTLVTFVKHFPTPNARDCTRDTSIKRDRLPDAVGSNKATGQLNPLWVEWLMGYPIGWTELKPLEMQ